MLSPRPDPCGVGRLDEGSNTASGLAGKPGPLSATVIVVPSTEMSRRPPSGIWTKALLMRLLIT